MSDTSTADTATDTTTTTTTTSADTGTDTGTDSTDWKAEAEKWQNLAKKHEKRAKDNATAASELDKVRQQSMTEQERAVEQARVEARTAALAEVGGKVAAAEIRAAAAGRLAPEQVDVLLDGINLARFLDDSGDVDRDKVTTFVDGIAPKADETTTTQFPDLGQGSRSADTNALNGDPLERALKSKLGIR